MWKSSAARLLLTCLSLLGALCSVLSKESNATDTGERKLFADLFTDYVREVRPRIDPTQNVTVTVDLELHHVKQMDEQQQVLHIVAFIEARWMDDYVHWEPSEYRGVRQLIVPPSKIWLPDFGIANSAADVYQDSFYEYFRVRVKHTGWVHWSYGGPLQISCPMDTTLYPFDRQHCKLLLENWAYSMEHVDLRNGSGDIWKQGHQDSGVWHLEATQVLRKETSYTADSDIYYPQLYFILHLQRKPRYYLLNVMLPCIFITTVALLTYWLPPESGEKTSLSITVLLAFSVTQLGISNSTPINSDFTPLMSIFVTLAMAMSMLSVVTTIFVLYCHFNNWKRPVPDWLQRIAFDGLARVMCMKLARKTKPDRSDLKVTVDENVPLTSPEPEVGDDGAKMASCGEALAQLYSRVDEISTQLRKMTSRTEDDDVQTAVADQWRALASVIDRLLFWITFLILAAGLLGMFVITTQHWLPVILN